MEESLIGRQIGQYELQAELGRGGMARVYRAFQPSLRRSVAIKVLSPSLGTDPQFLTRFEREATSVAHLQHPNIVPVFDFGQDDGVAYIVMMYVEGKSLAQYQLTNPALPSVLRIVGQVAEALDYAHGQGVVHRDVKPGNVLLQPPRDPTGTPWALLSDFGIAKVVQEASALTRTGTTVGTPEYMSPEQCQGVAIDGRSDIYSLGVVLFELTTGRLPFQSSSPIATAFLHINSPLPLPRTLRQDLPEAVESVILRATEKRPEDRYPSAGEMAAALTGALTPPPTLVPRTIVISGDRQESAPDIHEAKTAPVKAAEAAGDRLRAAGTTVGRAGQAVGGATVRTGHAVGTAAGQVVRADWSNALTYLLRRSLASGIAFGVMVILLSVLWLLSDPRGRAPATAAPNGIGGRLADLISNGRGASLELFGIGLVLGIPLALALLWWGVGSGSWRGGLLGTLFRAIFTLWLGLPAYLLAGVALLAVLVWAGRLEWVPADAGLFRHAPAVLLPSLVLAATFGSLLAQRFGEELADWRQTRWRTDWIARPILVLRMFATPFRLIGALLVLILVVEVVFEIPGIGLGVQVTALSREDSLLFLCLAVVGGMVVLCRWFADALCFLEAAFIRPLAVSEQIPSPSRSLGWLAISLLMVLVSLVLAAGRLFAPSLPSLLAAILEAISHDLATAWLAAVVGMLIGTGFAVVIRALDRRGGKAVWLRDLGLAFVDGAAAVPAVALLLIEVVFRRGSSSPLAVVALAALTALALWPRATRILLAMTRTNSGIGAVFFAVPAAAPALAGCALLLQATSSRLLDDGAGPRLGAIVGGYDIVAATLATFVLTPLAIAGWIALADAVAPWFGAKLPLPWSATQD